MQFIGNIPLKCCVYHKNKLFTPCVEFNCTLHPSPSISKVVMTMNEYNPVNYQHDIAQQYDVHSINRTTHRDDKECCAVDMYCTMQVLFIIYY